MCLDDLLDRLRWKESIALGACEENRLIHPQRRKGCVDRCFEGTTSELEPYY